MLIVNKTGIIIDKTLLGFESEGVMNPAAIKSGNNVLLFYRAVAKGNYSTIGYCKLEGPLKVVERLDIPLLFPQLPFESRGVEDARIVELDGLYYLTYTAYNGINALGALAISKDLKTFTKKGIIVPQITYNEFSRMANCKIGLNEKYHRYNNRDIFRTANDTGVFIWDKNLLFFPRRIKGKLVFLHRIKPDIQMVSVGELEELTRDFWCNYFHHLEHFIVLAPKYNHEVSYIGGGCPPIETEYGWLLIYHGVHDTTKGYIYSACAALLELETPNIEIARLPYPLFFPDQVWEMKGEVNNVCFPTGSVLFGDTLYIYYGAADERIAVASVSLKALVTELLNNKIK